MRFDPSLTTWSELERAQPALAARGREILYHFGVPLDYLATVRLSSYKPRGEPDNWPPVYTKWSAADPAP